MLVDTRRTLIKNAANAALALNGQLDLLLDAYDFYVHRYQGSQSALERRDLDETVRALGTLPLQIANQLDDWARDIAPELSAQGFEEYVLNELSLHMFAASMFFIRKGIDVELKNTSIGHAFGDLRTVNRLLS